MHLFKKAPQPLPSIKNHQAPSQLEYFFRHFPEDECWRLFAERDKSSRGDIFYPQLNQTSATSLFDVAKPALQHPYLLQALVGFRFITESIYNKIPFDINFI